MSIDPPQTSDPVGRAPAAPGGDDPFRALATELRSIAARASDHWPGFTDLDERVLEAAADGLEGIAAALADGMRQAFELGREYRHREELLERLNAEIGEISGALARQAWGGTRGGTSRSEIRGDGSPDG